MHSSRLTSAALLALAGTAITHTVLTHRRHRDRTVLEAAHLHQRLLAAQVERPGLRAIWGSLGPLEPAERRLHLHRNAWVSAWEAMFRVGALSADGVHGAAISLFATPDGQKWWTSVRGTHAPRRPATRTPAASTPWWTPPTRTKPETSCPPSPPGRQARPPPANPTQRDPFPEPS